VNDVDLKAIDALIASYGTVDGLNDREARDYLVDLRREVERLRHRIKIINDEWRTGVTRYYDAFAAGPNSEATKKARRWLFTQVVVPWEALSEDALVSSEEGK